MLSICFKAELRGGAQAFKTPGHVRFPAAEFPKLERLGKALANSAKGLLDFSINPQAKGVESLADGVKVNARFWAWFEAFLEFAPTKGIETRELDAVDPRVRSLSAYLEAHPRGGAAPYEAMERLAGLGRVQIDRLFLRDLGITPRGFLEAKLLAKAKASLLGGGASVKELACDLGFASAAHFCAWFKRQAGQRPSEYRASPR
jgi:transcriptional regulator GlxA family with amidase domain